MFEAQMIISDYCRKNVTETSRESYHTLVEKNNHCAIIFQHIRDCADGYTDGELHKILHAKGVYMQRCNVGARRHDINKILGCAVIINVNGESRCNLFSKKKERVWRVNETWKNQKQEINI